MTLTQFEEEKRGGSHIWWASWLTPMMKAGVPQRPLVSVAIAATIPVLLFGGWVAYRSAASERVAALAETNEVTFRVANQIVAELSTHVQVAEALALSSALDEPDLAKFYGEAQRIKKTRPLWYTIELDDLSGMQVLNLLKPLGTSLGMTADRDSFDEVVRTSRPTVGGVGPVGPISGQELVSLRVPVLREGELRYVLTVLLVPNAISAILKGSGAPEGWVGAVIDGTRQRNRTLSWRHSSVPARQRRRPRGGQAARRTGSTMTIERLRV